MAYPGTVLLGRRIRTFIIEAYRNGHWTAQEIGLVAGMSIENVGNILIMDVGQYAPIQEWFADRTKRKQRRIERLKHVRRWTFDE